MCTAISYKAKDHYFGRNLDLEHSYYESVTITPRNYQFAFRKEATMKVHYAIIGMAYVKDNYPLYYDATNEKGLSMAGLNFPGNAVYLSEREGMYNIAPFEIIPWVLGRCKTVADAKELLKRTNLIMLRYSKELPLTPLHFIVSDKESSIVIEPVKEGLRVLDNPVGVLTNNPPFAYQMYHLNNYMSLTKKEPVNTFAKTLPLEVYSRGMGGLGLPGDLSSASRFVRATFVKENSLIHENEDGNVSQFFHILGSVEQQKGCVQVGKEEYEYTIYSSCCNTEKGIYYYKTYGNSQISAVDMHLEDLEGDELVCYPLILQQQFCFQNNL
ncbi:MAG: choloylglycine hydrolase [Tyzzerella sp.]|nr:choloylglycine hydrolase [Tyzzerella sp.]